MGSVWTRRDGLYNKFNISRTDGESVPGGKHDSCDYFVLDLTHDRWARAAARAYAEACRLDRPILADDLHFKLDELEGRTDG